MIGNITTTLPEKLVAYLRPGAPALLPATDRPMWNGAPLPGRLLLIADQGYGDAIMFARYLPWALARAPDAVVAASADLHKLLQAIHPGLTLIAHWGDVPDFAAWCPLSSLPLLHGTTEATIPAPIPYLRPDPARSAAWRSATSRERRRNSASVLMAISSSAGFMAGLAAR